MYKNFIFKIRILVYKTFQGIMNITFVVKC